MRVRRFNSEGIQHVSLFLDSLTTAEPLPYPDALLDDPSFSDVVAPGLDAERRVFADRFELAEYLNSVLGDSGIGDIAEDQGLWAWLSLFFFDQLCPAEGGRRKPGERARWIPAVGGFQEVLPPPPCRTVSDLSSPSPESPRCLGALVYTATQAWRHGGAINLKTGTRYEFRNRAGSDFLVC